MSSIRTNLLEVSPGKSIPQPVGDAVLFGPNSVSETSHVFVVADKPATVIAYGLADDDELILEHVGGEGSGQFFQPVVYRGELLSLSVHNTFLGITIHGRFRLRYVGKTPLGAFYVEIVR